MAAGGITAKFKEYFGSLKYEWFKITWPERKQWVQSTIVVFIFVMILMAVLTGFDMLASIIVNKLMAL